MTNALRPSAKLAAVLATAGLALPAATATADSAGGAAYGQPASEAGSAALHARTEALLGRTLPFRGTTAPGARIAIQRLDPEVGWRTVTTATADTRGAYVARWRTDHIGVFSVRAVRAGTARVRASGGPSPLRVTVYKPAVATWYGPGLFGQRTACGQTLSHTLVGVAHRGLPCGRLVAILYRGRTLVAPVVDRGPFTNGASWDLTYAAAQALGFETTDSIGAVSLPAADPRRR